MWVYSINVLGIQAGKGTGDDRHFQHGVSEYLVSSFDGFRIVTSEEKYLLINLGCHETIKLVML